MRSQTTFILLLALSLAYLASAQEGSNTTVPPDEDHNVALLIITGPIIGKVTTFTARILFEFNLNTTVGVILTAPNGTQITKEKVVQANVPIVFAFDNLQSYTRYNVSLSDPNVTMVESYFTTLSGLFGALNFAVASCHDRGMQGTKTEGDLWADMVKRVENNQLHYLFLTGDQIYMDDSFGEADYSRPYFVCIEIIRATPQSDWNNLKPALLEVIRSEYRQTWGAPSVREALAKIPTMTILDDHDVRDDWGYLPEDYDPNTADYFYGTLARQVYYEYQRQLREDVDFNNYTNMTAEYYYEILNGVGFFFVDYRGIRSWNRPYSQMGSSQLGLNQTQLLQEVLNPSTGQFAQLYHFFLVSSLPVVFLVEKLIEIGYFTSNDAQESWSFAYSDEQIELLNLIRTWKNALDGRKAVILDGDCHMGGFTNIYYKRDLEIVQCTSSSIASSAPSNLAFDGFNLIKEVQKLTGDWEFEHHDWTNKFNYGIVITKHEEGDPKADCYLVEADANRDPEIIDSSGREVDESDFQDKV